MLSGMDTKDAGRLGGQLRAKKLSAKRKKEIAMKAALARWGKGGKRK